MSLTLLQSITDRTRKSRFPNGETGQTIGIEDIRMIGQERQCPGWLVESQALKSGIVPTRYIRNMDEISMNQQIRLLESTVAQVGLGGLGGTLLETFLRTGIGQIRGADGDTFEESNLNRQALSTPDVLEQRKSDVAKARAQQLNPSVEFMAVSEYLDETSLPDFLHGASIVVDALGGLKTRQSLQQAAAAAGIPLVTGALAGWTGYVGVVQPGMPGPADIMGKDNAAEEKLGCPAPAVNLIASIMASEVTKILSGTPSPLSGKILLVDLSDLTFETISL